MQNLEMHPQSLQRWDLLIYSLPPIQRMFRPFLCSWPQETNPATFIPTRVPSCQFDRRVTWRVTWPGALIGHDANAKQRWWWWWWEASFWNLTPCFSELQKIALHYEETSSAPALQAKRTPPSHHVSPEIQTSPTLLPLKPFDLNWVFIEDSWVIERDKRNKVNWKPKLQNRTPEHCRTQSHLGTKLRREPQECQRHFFCEGIYTSTHVTPIVKESSMYWQPSFSLLTFDSPIFKHQLISCTTPYIYLYITSISCFLQ